jgi:hypothetical protein
MIRVLFSPGCYGTYLARCLYYYTNLRLEDYKGLDFDQSGSSHEFRKNKLANQVIWHGHLTTFECGDTDKTIILLPLQQHRLDYYNNQYHKQEKLHLINYLLSQFDGNDIVDKLKSGWGYNLPLGPDIPRWILREFFSLWIADCLSNGYALDQYKEIPSRITVGTQDIINNFYNTFKRICQQCDLDITVTPELITETHNVFLKSQHYLNCQIECEQWVHDTIAGKDSIYTSKTIFDESYIQHIFITHGYEIKCDGLDTFPQHTSEMAQLIYANSNNYN